MNNPVSSLVKRITMQHNAGIVPNAMQEGRLLPQTSNIAPAGSSQRPLQTPPATSKLSTTPDTKSFSIQESLMARIFRLGFASIFLVNGLTAWLRPADFEKLLSSFPVAVAIGHINLMVAFAGFNDLILSGLILSGRGKKYVWAWAGSWLAMVSIIKLVTLLI